MIDIPKLRIRIKDFRAIKDADIILNGITVVAGINGCGKSSISKLLYRTVKTSIDFNKIVAQNLYVELRDVRRFLDELSSEINFLFRENLEYREKTGKAEFELRFGFSRLFSFSDVDLKEQEKKILSAIDLFSKTYEELPVEFKKSDRYKSRLYRLERFFKEEFIGIGMDDKGIDIPVILEKLKENIIKEFQLAYHNSKNRPIDILNEIIDDYFTEEINSNNFDIEELGALITDRNENKLSNFLTINKVAYIDTPMIIGVENIGDTNIQHWEELDLLLKNKGENSNKQSKIGSILKDEIIEGESNYDNNSDTFVYKRKDEFTIELLSCATGLKSFSLLQILFNNGFLDNKTLLILDEPEVHLHPEWIVQYARLVVLLHKEFKVNFLISSHNPDMVSAIKYISKKELGKDNDSVNFYIAKQQEKFSFDYSPLETDIDEIFGSFNSSLDKINEYGETED